MPQEIAVPWKQTAGAMPNIHKQIQWLSNNLALPEQCPQGPESGSAGPKLCTFCTHNVQFPASRPGTALSVRAIIELGVLLSHARSSDGNKSGNAFPQRPSAKRRDLPPHRPPRRERRRISPPEGVFNLDRTAAFMYRSHVLSGRSNVRCRAFGQTFPTVSDSRLRQTERGTPQAIYTRGSRYALAQEIRNSRFGAKF